MGNLSPNFYPNREGRDGVGNIVIGRPEIIVLHLTEGSFASAKGWLSNPASQASATRLFAKSGESIELVAESDAPWTNGFPTNQIEPPTSSYVREQFWNGKMGYGYRISPNLFSLTIEVEWFRVDGVISIDSALFDALVRQVADWCVKYNIPPTRERIIGHYEISPIEKPFCGKHIPWDYFIPAVAGRVSAMAVSHAERHAPSAWARKSWEWATKTGLVDGENPQGAVSREMLVEVLHRLVLKTPPENPLQTKLDFDKIESTETQADESPK